MTSGWSPFRLVPDDVLFFRDGKPSTLGDDHYLRSLFPPFPSTLYGALRTRRLVDENVDLRKIDKESWKARLKELTSELGEWAGFGSLRMRGPWLVRKTDAGHQPLFPAPADLLVSLREDSRIGEPRKVGSVARLRPRRKAGAGGWSHRLALLSPEVREGETGGPEPRAAERFYLTPAGLDAWRRGGLPAPEDFVDAAELWRDEARTGVGLKGNQRSHDPGRLYTFGFIRLCQGVSLGFDVTGSALTRDGRVRLGGEGRTAELFPGPAFPKTADAGRGELVAVAFATPALSQAGGYPPGFASDRLEGTLAGLPCRLVAAALSGHVNVGGWDVARGEAKPLRRAIPAGAVFLFQPLAGSAADLAAKLDGTCVSDEPNDGLEEQGFGLVLAGVC